MSNWLIGLEAVMQVQNLLLIVAGVLIGIVVGALPGISATVGIAILLPFTFVMKPLSGMMLLLGIYGGAVYAGSIPAVLVRAPGTPASAASVADGNALARQGRGDEALKISVLGSCIGGLLGVIGLALLAPVLASIALGFGPSAYFMLALLALTVVASVSEGRMAKGLIAGLIGVGIAMIGLDTIQGYPRLTFGSANLTAGINYIPVMIGLFAVAEAFLQFEKSAKLKLGQRSERFRPNLSCSAGSRPPRCSVRPSGSSSASSRAPAATSAPSSPTTRPSAGPARTAGSATATPAGSSPPRPPRTPAPRARSCRP